MNSEIESQSRCAGLSCNASLSAVRFNEWRGGPSCRPKCLPAELLARPAFSTAIFMAVWRVWPRGTTCHTSFFLPVSLPSSLLHLILPRFFGQVIRVKDAVLQTEQVISLQELSASADGCKRLRCSRRDSDGLRLGS